MLAALLLSAVLALPQDEIPFSLNFDRHGGSLPSGWELDGWGFEEGYRAAATSDHRFSGSYALELSYEGDSEPLGRGLIYHKIDARPFHGKRIALGAMVKVLDPGCTGRLMLRGSKGGDAVQLIAGHVHEEMRASDWTRFEVFGAVPKDVKQLEIGIEHRGDGSVLVDDVAIRIVGDLPKVELLPPSTLDEENVVNLAVLARLVGHLKYFHPSDQAATTEWDALTRAAVLEIEGAKGTMDLAEKLEKFFLPVAPTLRLFVKGRRPNKPSDWLDKPEEGAERWIVRWVHRGAESERERVEFTGKTPRGFSRPEKPKDYDLGHYVHARLATALYADAEGTLPHAAEIAALGGEPMEASAGLANGDRASRIATVILAWNAVQQLSPVLDRSKADWNEALHTALGAASEARDESDFLRVLREMLAKLKDGGARIDHNCDFRESNVPIRWEWLGDELVVTHAATDERSQIGVERGDVVARIDGQPAAEVFATAKGSISGATEQHVDRQALQLLLERERGAKVRMRIRSPKRGKIEVNYKDTFARAPLRRPGPGQLEELPGGVRYVDLARVTDVTLPAVVEQLASADGVVVDLRGGLHGLTYSKFLAHLAGGKIDDVTWETATAVRPDRDKLEWEKVKSKIEPAEPRIGGEIAFLVDGGVTGDAEALVAVARAAKLGKLVGSTTGGSIGRTASLELPAGFRMQWTVVRDSPPGKVDVYGEGLEPDVKVKLTLTGIQSGKDEVLAAALGALK